METRAYRLGYRSDIEGLRAIAILLVIAAHAYVPWLAGGFVGVDVFFVLSGYLITGLLLQEIDETGHLRFANFYARRLRRLLPALLVMLVMTCLVAAVVLAPSAQGDQAIAATTASLWLSNLHFALNNMDYFSPGAAGNLFLHTWSLGVEEQFYLLWPALIVCALWRNKDKARNTRRLKLVMAALGACSLAASIWLTRTDPQMAFYMMPLRAWQFAAGALIWLQTGFSRDIAAIASSRAAVWRLSGWFGLTLIVASALCFDANSVYPGWRALLPTAGAAAVIAAGAATIRSGVSRILSWRPLQAIGRVSYAWYLWHWPVLLLGGAIIGTSALERAALVLLSLLLAIASFRWIESPIRHKARWTMRPMATVGIAMALMIAASSLGIRWLNAATKLAATPALQRYTNAHSDSPAIYMLGCDQWFYSDQVNACKFGPDDAKHTAVLLGDSIGAQWFPAVASVFNRPGWRLLVITKSACPMVDEPIFYPRIGRIYIECSNWRRNATEQVASLHPDIVLLGSSQTANFTRTQWIEGTARLLKVVSASAGHVFILRGTPYLPFDGPDCLAARAWPRWLRSLRGSCSTPSFHQQDENVYQWIKLASHDFGNVSLLDFDDAICPGGQCAAERNGVIVFRDSQHLTAMFAESLSDEFRGRIDVTRFEEALPGASGEVPKRPGR